MILQVFGQRQRVTHQSRDSLPQHIIEPLDVVGFASSLRHVVLRKAQRLTTSAHRHTPPAPGPRPDLFEVDGQLCPTREPRQSGRIKGSEAKAVLAFSQADVAEVSKERHERFCRKVYDLYHILKLLSEKTIPLIVDNRLLLSTLRQNGEGLAGAQTRSSGKDLQYNQRSWESGGSRRDWRVGSQ